MKRVRLMGAVGALLVTAAAAHGALQPVDDAREVVLRFEPGTTSADRADVLDAADATASRPVPGVPGVRVLTLPSGASPARVSARIEGDGAVRWAEPVRTRHALVAPNDPLFGQVWGLAGPGADANVLSAWNVTTGSRDVAVSVVDTGVSTDHPDLMANLRGADGRNFVPATGGGVVASDWADEQGHGTHVAGTIGAVGNNGLGVAGVNWVSSIVPVRVLDLAGSGDDPTIASGIAYAADHSRIVNMSLGGQGGSAVMGDAIAAHPNTLFIAAAGNESQNVDAAPLYPCAFPYANVICVASTTQAGGLSSFSNFGPTSVDLGAPGTDIESTTQSFVVPYSDPLLTGSAGWTQTGTPAGAWQRIPTTSPSYFAWDLQGSLTAPQWDLTTPALPAFGGTDCRLDAFLDSSLNPGTQSFSVAASTNGVTWTTVLDPVAGTSNGFEEFVVPLGAYDGMTGVRLRFRVTGPSGTYGGVTSYATLMNPVIACVTPEPAGGTYGLKSGTSMATPAVAGAAALLLARDPSLTVAQLRHALLSTVTPTPGLAGATVTGGRLNIAAALDSLSGRAPDAPAAPDARTTTPMALTVRGAAPVKLKTFRWRVRVPLQCVGDEAIQCVMAVTIRSGTRTISTLNVALNGGWHGTKVMKINAAGQRILNRRSPIEATVRTTPRAGTTGLTKIARVRITRG